MRILAATTGMMLLAGFGSSVMAQTELPSLATVSPRQAGYSVTRWSVEDGLPLQVVTSLAQTPGGYLWGGTTAGLVRFDGNRFRIFGSEVPELEGVQILELLCDGEGRLWMIGIAGELVMYENGRFRRFGESDGFAGAPLGKLGMDDGGNLWINDHRGGRFYRFREGRFQIVPPGSTSELVIDRFLAGRDGVTFGVNERKRTMMRGTAEGFVEEPLMAPEGRIENRLGRFFKLQDGNSGIASVAGVYALEDGSWEMRHRFLSTIRGGSVMDAIEDWNGNFWISAYDLGLVLGARNEPEVKILLPDIPEKPFLRSLLLDSEGNLWIAGNDGLFRLRRNNFRVQPAVDERAVRPISAAVVEDRQGGVWLVDQAGWKRRFENVWTSGEHERPDEYIVCAAPAEDGSIFVGYRDGGFGKGSIERIGPAGERRPLGAFPSFVEVIFTTRRDELWVGAGGLWRWDGVGFVSEPVGMLENPRVRGIAEDDEGRLLVAFVGAGLYRKGREGWQKLTSSDDIGSTGINGIHLDADQCLWLATDQGFARWREGEWTAFEKADPAVRVAAVALTTDEGGSLWVSSRLGLRRFDLDLLNDHADGKSVSLSSEWFDRHDGLPSLEGVGMQSSMLTASDGRLWVVMDKGIAVMSPEDWESRRKILPPPPVHIEQVIVDDLPPVEPQLVEGAVRPVPIAVEPGSRRIEINFTAINLTANLKSRFRYRLAGVEDRWVDAGERREAVFHNLAPGFYQFDVTAENQTGHWNQEPASVLLVVEPMWWQRAAVRGLGVLLLTGLGVFFYKLRIRKLSKRRELHEGFARELIGSQEAERKRVAGELHDSLGQDLLVIKSRIDIGMADPAQLSESVGDAIQQVKQISMKLRPVLLERIGLAGSLRAMVDDVADATMIPIDASIGDIDGTLSDEAAISVYRLVQEALNNIVAHSDASEVSVSARASGGKVKIEIKDDGRGFDPIKVQAGPGAGLGLRGMEERVSLLGGDYQCNSHPGAGTTIRVSIPHSMS